MTLDAITLWNKASHRLQEKLNPDTFSRWIAVIHAKKIENLTLILCVSNDFYQSWLEEHYLPLIHEAIASLTQDIKTVKFEVDPAASKNVLPSLHPNKAHVKTASFGNKKNDITLDPNYVFKSFIIAPSNNIAHASSMAVAQAPGRAYNPLFIYGGTGLGKTHLMQAIGHYVLEKSNLNVRYVRCEALMNEYVDSLQKRNSIQFRKKYRSSDLLLIDDIHFLAKSERLQEEFFHTFNELVNAQKQVVMTSDRPAREIPDLEDRLVSRFEWGQIAELQVPDFETRVAILRLKQELMRISLPEEVINFIAANIRSNVRSLEGALKQLSAYISFERKTVTVELAESILKSCLEEEKKSVITIDMIQKKVADYFDLRLADMTSKHRSQGIALPRQVAMYLARTLTSASFPEIGLAFGKTHATALYAYRQVHHRLVSDVQLKQSIDRLTTLFINCKQP